MTQERDTSPTDRRIVEGLPQAGDICVERLQGRGRWRSGPDLVDDAIRRQHLTCVNGEQCQDGALTKRSDGDLLVAVVDLERSQHPKFHAAPAPRVPINFSS